MDEMIIERLNVIVQEITAEVKQKKEWGNFGSDSSINRNGRNDRDECKRRLEYWALNLMAIAYYI